MRNRWFGVAWSFGFLLGFSNLWAGAMGPNRVKCEGDSLSLVFSGARADLVFKQLRLEASTAFQLRQVPSSIPEWNQYRAALREKVIEKAGIQFFPDLPLNYRETGTIQRKGYRIKNILFQTRPGVYATVNLYVPEGPGPFPAVLTMHGHWPNGKTNAIFQSIGHSLALNGYVCLVIDTWGSGERTSVHGVDEYHGSNLGASVLNLGETLLGVQVSDNVRGIDLLCSFPFVDSKRIGATGASGGGNQTMWLAAVDERVKAAMPVVSVGTFDSYIMEDNCVCEVLPDGLQFTEESGILALTAPRALKICNVVKDPNPTFVPAEMLRSYKSLAPVYLHTAKARVMSYKEQFRALLRITSSLLSEFNGKNLYDEGKLDEPRYQQLEVINAARKLELDGLKNEDNDDRKQYIKVIKKWLKGEKKYFKDVGEILQQDLRKQMFEN